MVKKSLIWWFIVSEWKLRFRHTETVHSSIRWSRLLFDRIGLLNCWTSRHKVFGWSFLGLMELPYKKLLEIIASRTKFPSSLDVLLPVWTTRTLERKIHKQSPRTVRIFLSFRDEATFFKSWHLSMRKASESDSLEWSYSWNIPIFMPAWEVPFHYGASSDA